MPAPQEQYDTLQKEDFFPANPAARTYEGAQDSRSPYWRAAVVDLPHAGSTLLQPLRIGAYSKILPHAYSSVMEAAERGGGESYLAELNRAVLDISEPHISPTHHTGTELFHSLLSDVSSSPYCGRPELATSLNAVFDMYKDEREKQRRDVAKKLSDIIARHELYLVCRDKTEFEHPDATSLFAARLIKIINSRDDDRMQYETVVEGRESKTGTLPENFHILYGVRAPAAN